MDSDRLDKLIDDVENYTKTLSRFYTDKLYVESNHADEKSENTSPELGETVNEGNPGYGKLRSEAEPVNETDLFGNVTNRKEDWESASSIDELNSLICECQKCALGQSRTKFVFGVGNPNADVVLIGEAPGAEEDIKGEPFVGRAGKLLDKILEAVGFKREDVFICNILKCRPPGNRNPQPDEIEKCLPYLYYQIKLIKPKIILLLGRTAAEALLKSKQPLNKMRGKIHQINGIRTLVTFHPAALLRNPEWKRPAWEDMKEFKKLFDSLSPQDFSGELK